MILQGAPVASTAQKIFLRSEEARSEPPIDVIAVSPDVCLAGTCRVEPERVAPRRRVRLAGPRREQHPLIGAPPPGRPRRPHGDLHPGQDGVRRVPEAVPRQRPVVAADLEAAGVLDRRVVAPARRGPRGVGGPEQRRRGRPIGRSAVEDLELAGFRERERRRRRGGGRGAVGDPDDGPRHDAAVPDAEVEPGGLLGVRREEAHLEHPLRRGHQRLRRRQRLPLLNRVRRLRRRATQPREEQDEKPRRGGHGGETEHSSAPHLSAACAPPIARPP
jgi:hypothetical protein